MPLTGRPPHAATAVGGKELVVNVRLRKLSEVSGMGYALDYDPAVLAFTRTVDLSRDSSQQWEKGYRTAVYYRR